MVVAWSEAEPWCRPVGRKDLVRRVCISGGAHGNERNGVQLARHFAKLQGPPGSPHGFGFDLSAIEANPEAVKANVRFVDEDLNRCFRLETLEDPGHTDLLEHRRAKELNALLGPKSSPTPRCDYCFDLHNTTANTGVALMLHPRDTLSQEIAAYLISLDPEVRVCFWPDREPGLLPSLARGGMTFEVGPVSWGCLDAEQYHRSRWLLEASLRYLDAHNRAVSDAAAARQRRTLEVFQPMGAVSYPRDRDSGELLGMIHEELQGHDFRPLAAADPVFSLFDGTSLCRADARMADGTKPPDSAIYPWFINEAAYYPTNVAFLLGQKSRREVDILVLDGSRL